MQVLGCHHAACATSHSCVNECVSPTCLRPSGSTVVAFGAVGQGSPVGTMPPKRDKWVEVKDDDESEDDTWGNWGSESSCSQSAAGGSVHTEAAAAGPTAPASSTTGAASEGAHPEAAAVGPSPYEDVRVKQDPSAFRVTRITPDRPAQQAQSKLPAPLAPPTQQSQAPKPQTPRAQLTAWKGAKAAKLTARSSSPASLRPFSSLRFP